MKSTLRSILVIVAAVCTATASLLGTASLRAEPARFDNAASSVAIVFRQMGVSVDAKFNKIQVDGTFNAADLAGSAATITIDMASFDLGPGAEEYNDEVKAPDWFDTAKFPTAQFKVTDVQAAGASDQFRVNGQLTIKGIQKPITAEFRQVKTADQVAFEGSVPVSRLAFNIGQGDWKDTSIVEDEVLVRFRIVGSE